MATTIVLGEKTKGKQAESVKRKDVVKKVETEYNRIIVKPRLPRRGDAIKQVILVCGPGGVGKTTFAIEYYLKKLEKFPEAVLWFISNDGGFDPVWEEKAPVDLDKQVKVYEVANFDEEYAAQKEVWERADHERGDVFVVDHLQISWEGAEISYIYHVFGQDIGPFYAEMRRAFIEAGEVTETGAIKGAHLDGFKDWAIIKQFHNEGYMDKWVQRPACDFIACATLEEAKKDKKLFGPMGSAGVRPGGEKRNYYRFPIVVWLDFDGEERIMRIPKLRGKGEILKPIKVGKSVYDTYLSVVEATRI
jgi:hypothetical protein